MAIKLTKRQDEVKSLLLMGYSNQQIANELEINVQQVKRHASEIYSRQGIANRIELMAKEILRLTNEIRLMEMERDER